MITRPFLLHALSPLHAGTGSGIGIIDLPIARMKATGIPLVPGSSIKGVLRNLRRDRDRNKLDAVFGPAGTESEYAGAVVVSDARLLALPVRSFLGTFAWVTSPLLLALAQRDLQTQLPIPEVQPHAARTSSSCVCRYQQKVYLEEIDLDAVEGFEVHDWAAILAPLVSAKPDILTKRLVIVDDESMSFLWETATQVDARVRIDEKTRTVASGALWYEESLPPESLLVGVLAAEPSRKRGTDMSAYDVLDFALDVEQALQLGGKASTGRGQCRMIPFAPTKVGASDHVR